MRSLKAGWLFAPCVVTGIDGMTIKEGRIVVDKVERNDNKTTFIGRDPHTNKPKTVTVDDSTYVGIL